MGDHSVPRGEATLARFRPAARELRRRRPSCDLPQIEGPTGRFLLTQMVAVAEFEAGLIGERTRKALAAAKARGKKLGTPTNLTNTDAGRIAGRAQRSKIADRRAGDLASIIRDLQSAGLTINACARELTRRGISTPTGKNTWVSQQVVNVLA